MVRSGCQEEIPQVQFKVRSSGHEDISHIQGKEQRLHFVGAAVKRYSMFKVRETQIRWYGGIIRCKRVSEGRQTETTIIEN